MDKQVFHRDERGAIVAEATIALSVFIFMIFTLLSIVNIYFIQAKMSTALNSAAKEISQYCYLYYKTGANDYESDLHTQTADSRATAEHTISGVNTFVTEMKGASSDLSSADFDGMASHIDKSQEAASSLYSEYADKLSNDPTGFILGMAKLGGEELKEEAKVLLGQVMAKAFMKKNLASYQGQDPDDFLKRYRVIDGFSGLDFNYTSLMAYGSTNQLQLVVTYKVKALSVLGIDYSFTFRQCAKTLAWGEGVSKITDSRGIPSNSSTSVWDNKNTMQRGKQIVAEERKGYSYTSTSRGFDAFDPNRNQFISIISVNTSDESYKTADGVRKRLSSAFSDMYSQVSGLGEDISVQNQNGETVTVHSDQDSRTYKIELVVPENAPDSVVQEAIKEFKERMASQGYNVTIDVKKAYGSPSVEPEPTQTGS